MIKLKATPGPWRCEGPDDFGDWNILHDGDSLAIAAVVSNMRMPQETEANAHLTAAVQELYEALEDMLSGWRYIRKNHGDLYGVGWDRAEGNAAAALAKARGEQS